MADSRAEAAEYEMILDCLVLCVPCSFCNDQPGVATRRGTREARENEISYTHSPGSRMPYSATWKRHQAGQEPKEAGVRAGA